MVQGKSCRTVCTHRCCSDRSKFFFVFSKIHIKCKSNGNVFFYFKEESCFRGPIGPVIHNSEPKLGWIFKSWSVLFYPLFAVFYPSVLFATPTCAKSNIQMCHLYSLINAKKCFLQKQISNSEAKFGNSNHTVKSLNCLSFYPMFYPSVFWIFPAFTIPNSELWFIYVLCATAFPDWIRRQKATSKLVSWFHKQKPKEIFLLQHKCTKFGFSEVQLYPRCVCNRFPRLTECECTVMWCVCCFYLCALMAECLGRGGSRRQKVKTRPESLLLLSLFPPYLGRGLSEKEIPSKILFNQPNFKFSGPNVSVISWTWIVCKFGFIYPCSD